MKALVYTDVQTLVYQDAPDPVAGAGQVLIKIESSGICGSDMHAFLGHDERRPAPLIFGHEAAGTIIGGERDGQRVTVNPLNSCGECQDCLAGKTNLCQKRQIISMPPREGAFADYVAVPSTHAIQIPDHLSCDQASLTEPLACGWHAVRLAAKAHDGSLSGIKTAVIGGGAIGVGAALCLRAFGADDIVILEPNAVRREHLIETLDIPVVDPAELKDSLDGQCPLVIDAVGYAATRETACKLARQGGVIMHIGLGQATEGVDVRRLTLQEITFIGTYTYTFQDFLETAQAMADGRLGKLDWTQTRDLKDGQQAFEDIRAGRVAAPKIVLRP